MIWTLPTFPVCLLTSCTLYFVHSFHKYLSIFLPWSRNWEYNMNMVPCFQRTYTSSFLLAAYCLSLKTQIRHHHLQEPITHALYLCPSLSNPVQGFLSCVPVAPYTYFHHSTSFLLNLLG